jgi:hypothetical protein
MEPDNRMTVEEYYDAAGYSQDQRLMTDARVAIFNAGGVRALREYDIRCTEGWAPRDPLLVAVREFRSLLTGYGSRPLDAMVCWLAAAIERVEARLRR